MLLATKLYVPPLSPRLVPRPHLIQRLEAGLGLGHLLTLISAPAGSGKTTLLGEWLHRADPPVAWISLDDGDNEPSRFLSYLLAALQQVDAGLGQEAQAGLRDPHPLPLEPILTSVINDIAARSQPLIVVLDDYHVVAEASIHEALGFLLEHLPPSNQGLHLVIATRADPPLPIARLRARDQLTELHAADLRFAPGEVAAYLNERMELALSREQVGALQQRTEGWIAGLQLAALSLQGHEDAASFIQAFTGSQRYMLDYLTEEVLNRQSQQTQAFLLQTAVLERMTGPLCDAVTQGTGSQGILESLEAANLFVVPLDEHRHWYRYHRLFADLLRQRLGREHRQLIPELHRRASRWYEDNGLLPEAIDHLLAAGDFEPAAHLVEEVAWPQLARGEMRAFLRWLDALPHEVVRARPRLSVLHGWGLALTGRVDGVEACLVGVDLQPVQGEVAALRGYVADLEGDLERASILCRQALDLLSADNLFLRSLVALILGTGAYWRGGDPLAALKVLADAATLGQASGSVHLDVTATCTLGHVQMMQGQLHLAVETFGRAFQIARGTGRPPTLFVGLGHLGMAEVLYEWNELEEALRHAQKGIELGERAESVDILQAGYSYLPLARLYQALGDGDKAWQAVQKAERSARRWKQAHIVSLARASQAQLWLAQGDLPAAAQWAHASRLMPSPEPQYQREYELITVARVLFAEGNLDEALGLLQRLEEPARNMGRAGRLIQILALQALVHQDRNDEPRAVSTLERALSLAEPEGYVRTFVDEGEAMARLLSQALAALRIDRRIQGPAPTSGYVSGLLAAFEESTAAVAPQAQGLVEPLTKRELEVLYLIAAGLSNQEIAEDLVIALSTVKSHVNHIYGKLDVRSRTQALARAHELALL